MDEAPRAPDDDHGDVDESRRHAVVVGSSMAEDSRALVEMLETWRVANVTRFMSTRPRRRRRRPGTRVSVTPAATLRGRVVALRS
jgi:hypothetical protein